MMIFADKNMSHKKRTWREEEDHGLLELIEEHGPKDWTSISRTLQKRYGFTRSAKQCRDRWYNQLSPAASQEPWSDSEERILHQSHFILGNKWAGISKLLPGRTENCVKNHFYSAIRKQQRVENRMLRNKDLLFYPSELSCPTSRQQFLDLCLCPLSPSLEDTNDEDCIDDLGEILSFQFDS